MAINVLYNSVDTAQKKYQKSITDVSPNATPENITTFVQGLNALSTNTITGIRRVETTDLLNPEEDTRLDRNLALSQTTIAGTDIGNLEDPTLIDITGLGLKVTDIKLAFGVGSGSYYAAVLDFEGFQLCLVANGTDDDSIIITVDGDETYKPATVTLTITK